MTKAEYKKEWKRLNKDREKANNDRWYEENKKQVSLRKSEYYIENLEKEKSRTSEWKKSNRDKISKIKNSNPSKRLAANIRSKISALLAGRQKTSKSVDLLGCSFEELKKHLESKFQPGMTWDNYGQYGWHVDHIKPLASFNLTDESQLKQAWSYTNLQPLWARDNLTKGKKIDG